MASLREVVSQYKEELRDGIAWLVFWKEGRSWKAEYFYLEPSEDTLLPEGKELLEKIQAIDPAAVVLNSYYCGFLAEDMSVAELASGVRCHYENGYSNIADFIKSHEFSLREKQAEAAKEAAGIRESKEPIAPVDHHTRKKNKPKVSEITLKNRAIYQRRMKAYRKAMNNYQKVRSRSLSAIP